MKEIENIGNEFDKLNNYCNKIMPKKEDNILKIADKIIFERAEEKEREYGPINESISKAALIASELCNKDISTEDFYKCMIALKISRMAYNIKKDTMVDCVAYIAALENYKNNKNEL
jgi:hypothetical protein